MRAYTTADGLAQCFGCGGIIGMGGRQLTRARYSIQGDGATDCLLACCCAPCSLTQESRELELEEQSLGHAGAGFSQFMAPQGGAGKVFPFHIIQNIVTKEDEQA
jgi:hypothetical protein